MTLACRVSRLEHSVPGGRLPTWARAMVDEVAVEMGLDSEEVMREAEAILARAEAVGVLGSGETLVTFVAAESGIARDVILADAQRLMERS